MGALEVARESGLVQPGEPLLVMLSGGADSVCLLDVAVRLDARVSALHVNYGLRGEDSDADEEHCRQVCGSLGVPVIVQRVQLGPGNMQAAAREARYALAERHADADYAAAHTLSDQAETVLYRLAVSPGRRALLGMAPRRGRLVRPLLGATREETREHCIGAGLSWREDASNADHSFARVRVREELMPVLRELSGAAEQSIAETAAQLREEAEVLETAVDQALERLGAPAVPLELLRSEPPALARLVLRRMAEAAAGRPHALSRTDCEAILNLALAGTVVLDLGGGLRAIGEYGVIRFSAEGEAVAPEAVRLPVPGRVRFGEWEVSATEGKGGEAILSAVALGDRVVVRSWQEGDRIAPAGMGGSSKSLQDLFTDRKVPRELRGTLPVIEAGGEIAWVAGVAVGQHFIPRGDATVGLSARLAGPG